MIRIGLISFAHMHAYSYAACLAAIDDVELARIWDDDARRGRAAAKQFGCAFVPELEAFLGSGLDGAIVCSENVTHRAMVEAAANAGLCVLCEKPLATTIADAKAMIAACERAGVGLGTAFPCRFITSLQSMKAQVDRGDLGQLYAGACTNNGRFPGGWFADTALSGGGATMDHTVHVSDALRWITGQEIVKVYCEKVRAFQPQIDTDDTGSVHFEMENGAVISHVASWNRARSFPTWGDVTIELIGSKTVLGVDAFRQKIDVYDDGAMKAEWVGWGENPDLGLVRDFVESIREKRLPAASGLDGLRAVQATVAAYRSAETGKVERVGLR